VKLNGAYWRQRTTTGAFALCARRLVKLCLAYRFLVDLWTLLKDKESISPTFYERNCANFFALIKSLTFTSSTKKLRAKLLYKKAVRKMLVKLTQG
jgi:hypothetical protein